MCYSLLLLLPPVPLLVTRDRNCIKELIRDNYAVANYVFALITVFGRGKVGVTAVFSCGCLGQLLLRHFCLLWVRVGGRASR